jgi:hypothetical protein
MAKYDYQNKRFSCGRRYIFEIEPRVRLKERITGIKNAFVVSDDIEYGSGNRIPLLMSGLMY